MLSCFHKCVLEVDKVATSFPNIAFHIAFNFGVEGMHLAFQNFIYLLLPLSRR